jgi:hypothetical protein
MQNTAKEWQQSSAASRNCSSCHMRLIQGNDGNTHRDHRFYIRDAAFMANAVSVSANLQGPSVRIVIENRGVGHSFPTGDIFRRLVVRAYALTGAVHREPLSSSIVLERRFRDVPVLPQTDGPSTLQRVQVDDTRLGPVGTSGANRELTLAIPESKRSYPVFWQLVYQRMSPRLAQYFGVNLAEEELIVAEGVITPRKDSR